MRVHDLEATVSFVFDCQPLDFEPSSGGAVLGF